MECGFYVFWLYLIAVLYSPGTGLLKYRVVLQTAHAPTQENGLAEFKYWFETQTPPEAIHACKLYYIIRNFSWESVKGQLSVLHLGGDWLILP